MNVKNFLVNSDHSYRYYAIGIICLGLSLRLMGLNKGIWLDEYSSLYRVSEKFSVEGFRSYNHPPFYFILLKLWSLINLTEPFLRLLSVIFGIGTIVVVIKWIKQYSNLAGILAGLCCATMPGILRYSQEIRGYSLLLFVTALSFLFVSNLFAKPEKLFGYVGLASSLIVAVSTHLIGVILIPSICLFIAMSIPDRRKLLSFKLILAIGIPCALFILEYFFFMSPGISSNTENWWMPRVTIQLILYVTAYLLGASSLSWSLSAIQQYGLVLVIPIGVFLFGSFILFVGSFVLGNWRRSLPLLCAAVSYWLQLLAYSLFKIPIFWDRTALPAIVPLIGFIGVQIATIKRRKLRLISIIALVLLSINTIVNWVSCKAWIPFEHSKQIAQSLKLNWKPQDLVVFYPSYFEGVIKYYYPELPDEAIMSIRSNASSEEFETFRTFIKEQSPSAVFLVVRNDDNVRNHPEAYRTLQEILASEIGDPHVLQRLEILSIIQYRKENMR